MATAQIRIDGDRVRAVALVCLHGVEPSGRADVAPLGIQDDGYARVAIVNVGNQSLQVGFPPLGGEIGCLRLERTSEGCSGIYDGATELQRGNTGRQPFGVRVQPNA